MSIRNMDADVASNKLNELFHLHRYEDCVLFINRLSHLTIKLVISQISIDMYLSRLPYTIEILEALYAKVFIMDPDNFPVRSLQPERVIDKMVAYFSLLSDQTRMEPIDGAKMLDSFENVIRIISYVQPNLYSRLLYFKYAVDKGLLRLEKDQAAYTSTLQSTLPTNMGLNHSGEKTMSTSLILNHTGTLSHSGSGGGGGGGGGAGYYGSLRKSVQLAAAHQTMNYQQNKLNKTAVANSILISRVSNMQACEQLRNELTTTIQNCDKSLHKLNEFITQLKSQKQFKEIQFFLNHVKQRKDLNEHDSQENTSPHHDTNDHHQQEQHDDQDSATLLKASKAPKSIKSRSESVKTRRERSSDAFESNKKANSNANNDLYDYPSAVVCQDVIQNRLFLNKAMMNSVEPFLQTVKLQQLLTNLYEKIDLDKEILLVFTHLKREERYLSSLEPLQPLFRRYSLGFERCIQIWRRKCSADSLLLFNDKFNTACSSSSTMPMNKASFQQSNKQSQRQYAEQIDKLYIVDNEESNQLDQLHSSYSSSALAMPITNNEITFKTVRLEKSSGAAAAAAAASTAAASLAYNHYHNLAECYLTEETNGTEHGGTNCSGSPEKQKFFSEVNLYTSPSQGLYNTMPTKLRTQKLSTNLTVSSFRDSFMLSDETPSGQTGLFYKPSKSNFSQLDTTNQTPVHQNGGGVVRSDTFDSLSNLTDAKASKTDFAAASDATSKIGGYKLKGEDFMLVEKQQEIDRLNNELNVAKETIVKLRKNESKLREKLQEIELSNEYQLAEFPNETSKTAINLNHNEYTSDLIQMYVTLNKIYRLKAYDSLDSVKEIQSMNEFKLKLLFSVVILAYRYVKLYIRDLKRRVKTILQIPEQRITMNKTNSLTNGHSTMESNNEPVADDKPATALVKSGEIIENALNKYLQVVTTSKSFDLNKIVEDVKEQLWTTLYDYPLKECHDLNNFINESVKTSWSLINHDPSFKLDYTGNKFDSKLHERTENSNKQSDHIIQYVWPSLMDTVDNFCLSKAIVIT